MGGEVLVVDDDEGVRPVIAEILPPLFGRSCLAVQSFDAMVAHAEAALSCDLAILDVNLGAGTPNGVDAYHWLRDHEFRGKIFFLTGHAYTHPAIEQARSL